ncbi:MerR family transcriptional regulator [Nocardioides marmoraquaticus]
MHKTAPLIGSAQAAEVLGVNRATFNRWVSAGKVPVAVEMAGATGARLFDAGVIDELAYQRSQGAAEASA